MGQRSASQDHSQVLALLSTVGVDGMAVEKDLRRLLPFKTIAEYEPIDIALSDATKAVERAKQCVVIAIRLVEQG